MLTVENDWVQYEELPVRRVAVRGGGACAQRIPVVQGAPHRRPVLRAAAPVRPVRVPPRRRLRLTRRGRLVLVVLPGLLTLSGALAVLSGTGPAEAAAPVPAATAAATGAHR